MDGHRIQVTLLENKNLELEDVQAILMLTLNYFHGKQTILALFPQKFH